MVSMQWCSILCAVGGNRQHLQHPQYCVTSTEVGFYKYPSPWTRSVIQSQDVRDRHGLLEHFARIKLVVAQFETLNTRFTIKRSSTVGSVTSNYQIHLVAGETVKHQPHRLGD